jgi:hypothetical protein
MLAKEYSLIANINKLYELHSTWASAKKLGS